VKELLPSRDVSRAPLFQHLLNLHNTPQPASAETEPQFFPAAIDPGIAKLDLTLDLRETPSGLAGWFEYNTDLFEAATIARLAGHWEQLLTGIAADAGQRIGELPLLTTASGSNCSWTGTTRGRKTLRIVACTS